MARRKLHQRQVRNIQKSQDTYYVTIPIELMRELGWQDRQKVEVKKFGAHRIVITDWKK